MGAFNEQLHEARGAMGSVFRNPSLRRLQLALAGSVIGDWAYAIAVSVYVYSEAGPGAVGALGVARYVTMAVVTPFAATLADRFPRRTIMITSDLLRAALVIVAAIVIEVDGPAGLVFLLAVLTSACGTAFRPAQSALLPSLVQDPNDLTAANVVSSTIDSVGFFVGPALAGILLGVTNVPTVYAFNAATFVWSAVLVLSIRHVETSAAKPVQEARPRLLDGMGAGFSTIVRSRDLRLVMGLYVAQTIIAGASLVYEVAIAIDLLDLGESGLGFLSATLGIGGLIGGFLALILARHNALARHFGLGVMLWSAPLLLVAFSPTVVAAVAAMILIGVGNSVVDVNVSTMLQRVIPPDVMGRVFGAMETALIAGMAIGSLAMPLLISSIGLRPGLVVLGGAVTAVAAVAYGGLHRIDRTTMAPRGLDILSAVPLLAPLPRRIQEQLARHLVRVELGPGEILFREGDVGDRFYVIDQGTVEVSRSDAVTVEIGRGGHFGEIALLRDAPRNATITAIGHVVLLGLDRDVFIPAVTSNGDALNAADVIIARRIAVA